MHNSHRATTTPNIPLSDQECSGVELNNGFQAEQIQPNQVLNMGRNPRRKEPRKRFVGGDPWFGWMAMTLLIYNGAGSMVDGNATDWCVMCHASTGGSTVLSNPICTADPPQKFAGTGCECSLARRSSRSTLVPRSLGRAILIPKRLHLISLTANQMPRSPQPWRHPFRRSKDLSSRKDSPTRLKVGNSHLNAKTSEHPQ